MADLADILTGLGTMIEGLTPSPALPAYTEQKYRIKIEEQPAGDAERSFQVRDARDPKVMAAGNGATWTQIDNTVYLIISHKKKGFIGGGGTMLDGRTSKDVAQIIHALRQKSNWPTGTHNINVLGATELLETDKALLTMITMNVQYRTTS